MMDEDSRPVLMAVDDTRDNLTLIHSLFRNDCRLLMATNGQKALQLVDDGVLPDLVLLDVMMPDMDGFELCRRLKANLRTRDIPVIFLTALSDSSDEKMGFEAGGVDFVTKPINIEILAARVRTHLELKKMRDTFRNQSTSLQAEVVRRTRELTALQDATILAMAALSDMRDDDTGNHVRRTQQYVRCLGTALLDDPRFYDRIDEEWLERLVKISPLHDLGKIRVPDAILRKPGRLETDEFEVVKTHAKAGWDALDAARRNLPQANLLLDMAAEVARWHHEKWDGSGYPDGLAGEAIPLSARVMALADVYDALVSKRVYKQSISHEDALVVIREGSGKHFDPALVEVFLSIASQIHAVWQGLQ